MQVSEKERELIDTFAKLYIRIFLENHVFMSPAALDREKLINEALDFGLLYIRERNSKLK